ncbi:helix-turn-helix domain-containing protein [Alkalicoccobacillus porphyridii]|uniref:Helix-turn-helix domain-containing protein n=1 Tax=Alkalicoccobacillus porphyridii TaxID=2597270 RepID=A0A553ZYK7_9BACI|nr:AraC family transcriptional regulator [Alkalicoccobacillus porphyridii]TSB46495.1 helix-turn-helix domain-containing protein [Alkalicoccobacillus porphyridii]
MLQKNQPVINQMYEFDFQKLHHLPTIRLSNVGWETRSDPSYYYHGLTRPHNDGYVIFQYTLSGEGCLDYEGKHYSIKPGDAFFVSVPSDHRYYFPKDGQPWEFVFLTLGGQEAEHIWKRIVSVNGPVSSIGQNEPIIKQLFSIIQETKSDRLDDPFQASLHGYQFLLSCMKHFLYDIEEEDETEPQSFKQATRFIEENYHTPLTLEEIADNVMLSRYALIRMFKQHAGKTPIQYVNHLRIQQACKLLILTNKPIKEIAEEVGYANANYFNKAFRKAMDMSVGTFRHLKKV